MKRLVTVLLLLPAASFAADHAGDRPGPHFLLKSLDLSKPYATPAVANMADDVGQTIWKVTYMGKK